MRNRTLQEREGEDFPKTGQACKMEPSWWCSENTRICSLRRRKDSLAALVEKMRAYIVVLRVVT
jgi:hypothetical protein